MHQLATECTNCKWIEEKMSQPLPIRNEKGSQQSQKKQKGGWGLVSETYLVTKKLFRNLMAC
jgi:hypothetical protein